MDSATGAAADAAAHFLPRTPNPNLSKTAPAGAAPSHFRVCRNGVEIPTDQLPVQRAARGESVRDEEVEDVFEDGTVLHTLMSAAPLYDGQGRVRGAVHFQDRPHVSQAIAPTPC